MGVLAADEELVGRGHVLVEYLGGDRGESRVSHPGTVVTSTNLTQLVGAHTLHGLVVGSLVVLDGDLSGHTTLFRLAYFAHGVCYWECLP